MKNQQITATTNEKNLRALGLQSDFIVPGSDIPRWGYLTHLSRYVFASSFCQGKEVLEAGCGVGYGSSFLLAKGAKKITGIDISDKAIGIAKHFYSKPNLELICADMQDIPFENSSFDVIISFGALDHVSDAKVAVREFKRLLRERGTLITSVMNREFLTPPFLKHPVDAAHQKEFNCDEFLELVNSEFPDTRLLGQTYYSNYSRLVWWVRAIILEDVCKKFPVMERFLKGIARLIFPAGWQRVIYDEGVALIDDDLNDKFSELHTEKEKSHALSMLIVAKKV